MNSNPGAEKSLRSKQLSPDSSSDSSDEDDGVQNAKVSSRSKASQAEVKKNVKSKPTSSDSSSDSFSDEEKQAAEPSKSKLSKCNATKILQSKTEPAKQKSPAKMSVRGGNHKSKPSASSPSSDSSYEEDGKTKRYALAITFPDKNKLEQAKRRTHYATNTSTFGGTKPKPAVRHKHNATDELAV